MTKAVIFICKMTTLFAILRGSFAVLQGKPSSKSCPVWSLHNAKLNTCECYEGVGVHLKCNDQGYVVGLKGCSCSTYNWNSGVTTIGYCLYGCNPSHDSIFEAPTNISSIKTTMCSSYKRNGSLCGTCHKETYPASYSFSMTCIYCKHTILSWIAFFMWTLTPVTIFYVIVMLLSANLMSSKLSGYIIFSQSITSPFIVRVLLLEHTDISRFRIIYQIFGAIYGIWNLDFLRTFSNGICLGTNSLITLFLDIVIAIYPLSLIMVTHICINLYGKNKAVTIMLKPVVKYITKFRKSQTSTIDSFATFIYLINIKILNSCLDLLIPVQIYKLTDTEIKNTSRRLFYDADIVYYGADHKPYGIAALTVLIFLVLLPTLLLLVYPFKLVQKLINLLLSPRWQLVVRTFVESFNQCYKDGTKEKEKDCRYFAAFPFVIRITIFLFYLGSPNGSVLVFGAIAITTYSLVLVASEPFRDQYKHLLNSYVLFNFILACSGICYALYSHPSPGNYRIRFLFTAFTIFGLTSPGVYAVLRFVYSTYATLHKRLAKHAET